MRFQIATVVSPDALDFVFQYLLQSTLFISDFHWEWWHKMLSVAIRRLKFADLLSVHWFPHVFIFHIPTSINYFIVSLNVSEEWFMVENAAYGPVETMNSRIVTSHFLTGQALPKNDLGPLSDSLRSSQNLPLHNPSVTALAICTIADKSVKTISDEQITK